MTVRQYVEANFTDTEKELFEYVLNSFPESILVQEGSESEDVLALLATLAKVIGSSKELIVNLKTSRSLNEIIKKVEEDYLTENNKKLLLPLASDLKYHRIPRDIETNILLDRLVDEKHFLLDNYNLYKNRGTMTAINQLVKKWAAYLGEGDLTYTLYELKNEINIVLEGLENFADFSAGSYTFNIESESIETAFIKKDSIIFDMLMSIKPVGINYNILLKYFSFSLSNLLESRVVREKSLANPQIKLSDSNLLLTTPQILGLSTSEFNNEVEVTIKNDSPISSLQVYTADWNSNASFLSSGFFEDIEQSWVQLESAVEHTQDEQNELNYIFSTENEMRQVVEPADGAKAIVTGYRWVPASSIAFNTANRKKTFFEIVTQENAEPANVFNMQNMVIPNYALWSEGPGTLVVQYRRIIENTNDVIVRFFRLEQVIPGGFNGGIDTVDENRYGYFEFNITEGFSFVSEIIEPNSTKTISYTSTDPLYNHENSFIAAYFTRPNDKSLKTVTNIVSFESLLAGPYAPASKVASLGFTYTVDKFEEDPPVLPPPETLTVTFTAGTGGTGSMSPQVMEKGVATALNGNTFTRSGYGFAGWKPPSAPSAVYQDEEVVTFVADVTLEAVWVEDVFGQF